MENPQFAIGLFEIGDCSSCLCSYICCPCALASARSHLDDSVYVFNIACLPCCCITPVRWMIRTAYDIPGDAWGDCLRSVFCPCCTINQLLQTSYKRGNTSVSGGVAHNSRDFSFFFGTCSNDLPTCCYTTLCVPCATGASLQVATGMPYILGCCCVTPCGARNIIRYQYRLAGDDVLDELCAPLAASLLLFSMFATPLVVLPIFSAHSTQIYNEAQYRGRTTQPKYLVNLSGYSQRRGPGVGGQGTRADRMTMGDLDRLDSGSDVSSMAYGSDLSGITYSSSPTRLKDDDGEDNESSLLLLGADTPPRGPPKPPIIASAASTSAAPLASLAMPVGLDVGRGSGRGRGKAGEEIGQGFAVAKPASSRHKKFKAADAAVVKL